MQIHRMSPGETLKAVGIGVLTALLLSAIMVPAFKFGIAPMPKPPALAFAQLLLGPNVPLPVGLLFHVAYVTFWAVVYVVFLWDRLTFLNALWLGLRSLDRDPDFLLPPSRVGIPRPYDQSKADSRVVGTSRPFRGVSVGIVPNRLQDEGGTRRITRGLNKPSSGRAGMSNSPLPEGLGEFAIAGCIAWSLANGTLTAITK